MENSHNDTDITAHDSLADISPSLGFPGGPGLIDTSEIRAVIPGLIAHLFTLFSPQGTERGAMARLWEIRGMLCQLHRFEKFNFGTWLTRSMQSDPAWQAQTREDLGGEAALLKWEHRRETLLEKAAGEEEMPVPIKAPTITERKKRKPSKPVEDRYGLFRLASLSALSPIRPLQLCRPSLPRTVCAALRRPRPIGLTPDQLRPTETPAQMMNSEDVEEPTPNLPRLTRDMLIKLWDRLHAQHQDWNRRLTIADMMISTPDLRGGFTPP